MKASGISQQYVPLDSNLRRICSKHSSVAEKNAVVSQQFESLLVKQFLNEALQPMVKYLMKIGRTSFTDIFTDSLREYRKRWRFRIS